MSDDVIEGEEGDAPVVSERVQVMHTTHQYTCTTYMDAYLLPTGI